MDLKKYVYDNGYYMLGIKKNIASLTLNEMLTCDTEMEEQLQELCEELDNYNDNDILVIDYDNGMGNIIHAFTKEDRQEIE